MRILVIGGGGFIGSHLAETLIKNGHKVAVVDIFSDRKNPGIKFYKIDISSQVFPDKIETVFEKEKPEIIYHLAAYMPKPGKEEVLVSIKQIKTGILGTLAVLGAIGKNCKGVKKIIFSSSSAVYGDASAFPTPENSLTNPISLYGAIKLCCEKIIELYCESLKIPYFIFRYSTVYGPGQKSGRVANLIKEISDGEKPEINRNQTRDFIYIDDIVKANLFALKSEKGGIYNIGSGVETSIGGLFDKISKILKKKIRPKYSTSEISEIKRNVLDIRKAKRDLGWSPKVALEAGLIKTIYF